MIDVDKEFLRNVWNTQPKGSHIVVCSKDPTKGKHERPWTERAFTEPELAIDWLCKQPFHVDVYFCPTWLNGKTRRKENVVGSKYLWSDLDFVDPRKLDKALQPTIAWESSPGRYQGLWEIQEATSPQKVEEANKALAYGIGADKSGFDLTQVLRIPGAPNNKYPEAPLSKLMWHREKPASIKKIHLALKSQAPEAVDEFPEDIPEAALASFEELLSRKRKQIGNKILATLLADHATEGNRSDVLWWLGHELAKKGLKRQEIFVLLQGSVWNKYAGRRDEDERLKHEIARAIEDEVLPNILDPGKKDKERKRKDRHDLTDEEVDEKAANFSFRVESDTDVMSNSQAEPGWLIKGFWTKGSHGIVAGEPKSFKSTLILDLCLSVASGEPFAGKFAVESPGPVLVVQNENANWIMKDRLSKIRAHKGLVGEVNKIGPRKYTFTPPPELPIHYINQQSFNLNDPVHRKHFEALIAEIRPVVTVLDPLYLMFDGDINSAKELNPILSWLLELKIKYQTAIIVVHHWNKGGGGSSSRGGQRMLGSTTLHGWTESAWYIATRAVEAPRATEGLEDEEDDVTKASGMAAVTIEREFRGAGMHPKVDLLVSMGEFGSDDYHIEVTKHKPVVEEETPKRGKGKAAPVSKEVIKENVVTELQMSTRPFNETRMMELIAMPKKVTLEIINELLTEGVIFKGDAGYQLAT